MERQKKPGGYSNTPATHKHKSARYSSGNYTYEVYNSGSRRLNRSTKTGLFFLSLLGGGFMSAASLLSVLLIADVTTVSIKPILLGLGLSLGLLFVVMTKSVLVTEGNVFAPVNFNNMSILESCLRLFRFWIIAWIGNILGAFLFAYLVYLSQDFSNIVDQNLISFVHLKLSHPNTGTYREMFELIISGLLANWFIALAVFFAWSSKNLINQFIILLLAAIFISATNFQYFPVNAGYFSLNAFLGKEVSLFDSFMLNLIPVTVGNIFGAGLLAATPLLFLSKKR